MDRYDNTGSEIYIIAEVSQNHDGSLGQAHAFIDAIAKTGANAVKFQTHIASAESTVREPFRVKFSYQDKNRFEYWKRMEWTEEQWKDLYEHAYSLGLDFISSPFSLEALEMLNRIGVKTWKFGSGEVFNDVLLNRAIETGKPIIISTGLCTMDDIDRLASKIQSKGNELVIMECTSAYPSKAEEIPIRFITELKNRYKCKIGISDHSATIYPSLSAVSLGATFVEVHVTMSREMFGPDVKASVTMDELRQIVDGSEFIYKMLNSDIDKSQLDDARQELKNMFSKSVYANCAIKAGDIISDINVGIKKPHCGKAISVNDYNEIIGKRINVDVEKDDPIEWRFLEI